MYDVLINVSPGEGNRMVADIKEVGGDPIRCGFSVIAIGPK
ncbi:hypothetical protein PUR28_17880 [Streptomyces sp. BE308]|nr:hypothetical protein [Streptomyces sp. BE308]MEE1792615.1 hypothetical protein [Streptomyces sp. BE308]